MDFIKPKDIFWNDVKVLPVNSLVKYYLMSSYLYYELDVNVFNDTEFDELCKILLKDFNDIKHMHKHLLDKDSLKASTGYTLKYPTIVKHLAVKWYNNYVEYINNLKRKKNVD